MQIIQSCFFDYLPKVQHQKTLEKQVVSVTTGDHFNLPGQSLVLMEIQMVGQVKFNNEQNRKEWESYRINKLNTQYSGLKTH